MKLSNKVLIGFFALLFLYLTAVFAEIRLRGIPNIIDDENSIPERVDISNVSYVVLNDMDKSIHITGSGESRLEVRSLSGDMLRRITQNISGDTLTLSGLKSSDIQTIKISLFVPKAGLKGITVDHAVAIVSGLEQASLRVSQKAGQIHMSNNRIGKISTESADGSYLDISAMDLDTLSAKVEESQVRVSSPIDLLEGSMKNNSFFLLNHVGEIQFKKDESSRLHLYP